MRSQGHPVISIQFYKTKLSQSELALFWAYFLKVKYINDPRKCNNVLSHFPEGEYLLPAENKTWALVVKLLLNVFKSILIMLIIVAEYLST